MKVKFCPRCKSKELDFIAGGITGTLRCRKCGYSGIFPEKDTKKAKKIKPQKTKKKNKK